MGLTQAQFRALSERVTADPRPFIERMLRVQTKQLAGQAPVSNLVFNKAQLKVHNGLMGQRAEGLPPRAIVLKARQPGISTQSCGYTAATAMCRPHSESMIVTHLEDASLGLFGKIDFMRRNLPSDFRPLVASDRQESIHFSSFPCVDGEVPLDSKITVATAGGGELWRGKTLQMAHLSEYAQMADAANVLLGVDQAVPKTPLSMLIIESTARGMGNSFHNEWLRAEAGESGFVPIFIGWWEIDEYQMRCPPDFQLESDELDMKKAFGLTNEQLQWRRYAIYTGCGGDEDKFNQEYPSSPVVAFLMSGRPAFPMKVLHEMYDWAVRQKFLEGEWSVSEQRFMPLKKGRLRVFKEPVPGHDYTIGADPSQGTEDGDPACIVVFDRDECEVVAVWHGWVSPVHLAHLMMGLGGWYNMAVLAPELNNGHGFSVVEELKALQYQRIYVWSRVDKVKHSETNYFGWLTSYQTRPLLIDSLAYALLEREVVIRDPETITELLKFQSTDARVQAAGVGAGDDRAMATMIAFRVHLQWPLQSTGAPPRIRWDDDKNRLPEANVPLIPPGSMNHDAWSTVDDDIRRMTTQVEKTGFLEYDVADPDDCPDPPGASWDCPW